jgi:hypothetical protein
MRGPSSPMFLLALGLLALSFGSANPEHANPVKPTSSGPAGAANFEVEAEATLTEGLALDGTDRIDDGRCVSEDGSQCSRAADFVQADRIHALEQHASDALERRSCAHVVLTMWFADGTEHVACVCRDLKANEQAWRNVLALDPRRTNALMNLGLRLLYDPILPEGSSDYDRCPRCGLDSASCA